MRRNCKGCYARDTGEHPLADGAQGCTLGYDVGWENGKQYPKEDCPKPKSWKLLKKANKKGE